MKRFNREMWKWTRRIIIAELIFLMFAAILSNIQLTLADYQSNTGDAPGSSAWQYFGYLNMRDYLCANAYTVSKIHWEKDFDFTLPGNATVTGIMVTAYLASAAGSTVKVNIGKNETVLGLEKTSAALSTGDCDQTTAVYFGNSGDLWNLTWTPSEVNTVDFTVKITHVAASEWQYMDYLAVTVYYSEAGEESGPSDTFNMLETAVNLTANPAYAWTTIDASSYIPSDATGVVLAFSTTDSEYPSANQPYYKARRYGSTDEISGRHDMYFSGGSSNHWHTYAMLMVGVDANRRFQFANSHTSVQLTQIIGWTGTGVTYRTNACSLALNSTSWTNYDMTPCLVSPSDTPKAAILWNTYDPGSQYYDYVKYYVRMDGSADNNENLVPQWGLWGLIVGVDSNIFEQKAATGGGGTPLLASYVKTYLVGYVETGPDFEPSPTSLTTCTSTNTTCDISSYVTSPTNTVIIWWLTSTATPNTVQSTVRLSKNYTVSLQSGRNEMAGGVSEYLSGMWLVDLQYDLTFWIHQRTNAGPLILVGYAEEAPGATTTTTPGTTTTISGGGFDLPNVPDAIGDALGIGPEAGGMLLSFILFFMILVPLGMLTKNFWIILITGLTFAGFLTAIQWLPVWIMVMLCLITALMLGSRLTGLASRGGSDEGD